jgi:mannitol-1-phosphate/altronate dehydrogenase
LIASAVLGDQTLWGQNLAALPGLVAAVQEKVNEIGTLGMTAVVNQLQPVKIIA